MSKSRDSFLALLFARHGTALRRFLVARFNADADVDDIAQEAWIRMQRVEHPERLENARAFLFQTASNLAIDHLRRIDFERQHFDQDADAADEVSGASSPERTVGATQQLAIVHAAIDELPVRCRQAFVMHRTRDMTYPEIARELNVSTSMVEKYVIQALKHCRRRLEAGNRDLSGRDGDVRRS
ncbi:MAG TPA: RNA polymerase sigma factor [Pseudomonadales bacterium]|nr:RNA polymerase sigma factor [Pseudomonadales bacterium]